VIISDTHRYLFVEQRHTACSAIEAELRESYGGRTILHKHATWADFLRVATPAQKRYFVFSGIRNPLDEAVSLYFKYKTDHTGHPAVQKQNYSRQVADRTLSRRQAEAFAYVTDNEADFATYLRRFYRYPYDNDTLIYHKRMDQLIRFEHLQRDFSQTLARLGLEQVRPLPLVNKTGQRGSYLDYYPPAIREHAARVFGPFMHRWGYPLPQDWVGVRVPRSATIEFHMRGAGRYVRRRYLRNRKPGRFHLIQIVAASIRR
jgi:hypothetical protein